MRQERFNRVAICSSRVKIYLLLQGNIGSFPRDGSSTQASTTMDHVMVPWPFRFRNQQYGQRFFQFPVLHVYRPKLHPGGGSRLQAKLVHCLIGKPKSKICCLGPPARRTLSDWRLRHHQKFQKKAPSQRQGASGKRQFMGNLQSGRAGVPTSNMPS